MRLSKLVPRLALTVLLPVFSTMTFSSAFGQTNDPAIADAQRLLKQGQHVQALTRVDGYLATKPKDPQGRFIKGLILTEMKRTSEAILVFKKLTEDFPELPEPYNNLAVLYAQEKQYDKARQSLEAAIKTHPAYAVAHENLGDIYAKLASQAYGKALQIDAGNTAAQTKIAMIRDLVPPTTGAANAKPASKPSEPIRLASTDPTKLVAPVAPAAKPVSPVTPAPAPAAAPIPPVVVKPAVQTPPPASAPAAPAVAPTVAPAPSKPAPTPPAANIEQEVSKALQAWASAWSRKDVKTYLAAYASDFQTPGGQGRKAWEQERESRITKPGKIEVGVEKIAVDLHGTDKATVKFRQNYRSANLKSSAAKTVVFVRSNGRWLIQQERVN